MLGSCFMEVGMNFRISSFNVFFLALVAFAAPVCVTAAEAEREQLAERTACTF